MGSTMSPDALELQACTVDLTRGDVRGDDRPSERLSARELDLLRFLVDRAGTTVSRDDLLVQVWGYSDQSLSRASDNVVRRLRQKLEADPAHPHHILTVRGEGYRFQPLGHGAPAAAEPAPASPMLVLDGLTIDLSRHVALREGETTIALTAQEARLLGLLHEAAGAVVSRTALVRGVWGHAAGRAVDHAIHRLRQKIEDDPANPRFLHTVRGAGFQLLVPAQPAVHDTSSAFVGREEELTQLRRLLRPGAWVLVVGPGGNGKTRLTRRALAARAGTRWFVPLAACDTPRAAVAKVAEVLGLVLAGNEDPAARVGAALRRAQACTLVLDNLEQLAGSIGPTIRAWRAQAPELCLVGTSRIRLGLVDEQTLEVGPLAEEHGVELYAARAQAAWSGYRMRGPEVEAVRRMVEHVHGSPLAIELAAARAAVLPAASMVERLDRTLALLVRPSGEGGRHDSLGATFAVSLELLEPGPRAALVQLGLFRAGFELADVEHLRGPTGLDELQILRDHHLVHTTSSLPRFAIVEPLREHLATERARREDRAPLELAWVRRVARLGEPELLDAVRTGRSHPDRGALRRSVADLEATLEVAVASEDPALAVRCLCALLAATVYHHPRDDALAWAERVHALRPSSLDAARLDAWCALTMLYRDRAPEVLPLAERAVAGASDLPGVRAVAWSTIAKVHQRSGGGAEGPAYAEAAEAFEEADAPARAAFCQARSELARGDAGAARRTFLLAERLAHTHGEELIRAHAARELGILEVARGRVETAAERFGAALAVFEAHDRVANAYAVLYYLQDLALWTGDEAAFAEATEGALAASQRRGSRIEEACSLALDAAHALATNQLDRAEESMAAARVALREHATSEPSRTALLDWIDAELALARGDRPTARVLASGAREALQSLRVPAWVAPAATEATSVGDLGAGPSVAALEAAPPSYAAFAWARRGLLAAARGTTDTAEASLERASTLARSAGAEAPTGWAGRLVEALKSCVSG